MAFENHDTVWVPILKYPSDFDNVTVVNGDILKWIWRNISEFQKSNLPIKV